MLRGVQPDYIHAISVHGYKHQRAYLVAQTPLPTTVQNFHHLMYDRMVSCVVQLTGREEGQEVCAQYWPSQEPGEKHKRFGVFSVELDRQQQCEGYIRRTFSLSKDKVCLVHAAALTGRK